MRIPSFPFPKKIMTTDGSCCMEFMVVQVSCMKLICQCNTLFLFYKKPTTWRVGSTFLRKPRFKTQKFLKLMKISSFCFLTFYHFQPQSFLRCLKFEPEVYCDIKNFTLNFLKYIWLHYQAIEIT